MHVGDLVRQSRTARGVSQAELAIRAGTTQTAISRLECGGISPTVDTLERVIRCLGLQLVVTVQPMPAWTDRADLAAAGHQTPEERLDDAITSMQSLAGLLGTATDA